MVIVQRWYYLHRNGDQSNAPFEFFYDNVKILSFDVLLQVLTELFGRHIKGGKVLKLYKIEKVCEMQVEKTHFQRLIFFQNLKN